MRARSLVVAALMGLALASPLTNDAGGPDPKPIQEVQVRASIQAADPHPENRQTASPGGWLLLLTGTGGVASLALKASLIGGTMDVVSKRGEQAPRTDSNLI